jgi:hypothetical protein
MTASNHGKRIDWLNAQLVMYEHSVHADYLRCVPKRPRLLSTSMVMVWFLPSLLALAWVMIFVCKVW